MDTEKGIHKSLYSSKFGHKWEFPILYFFIKKDGNQQYYKMKPNTTKNGHMEKWYVQPYNVGNGEGITLNPYATFFWMGVYF